jgi:hypothetical protein
MRSVVLVLTGILMSLLFGAFFVLLVLAPRPTDRCWRVTAGGEARDVRAQYILQQSGLFSATDCVSFVRHERVVAVACGAVVVEEQCE